MLTQTLVVVLVIAAILAIGMLRESRRERSLRTWIKTKPGARLHWPFKPEDHPSFPAADLVERFIQRPPLGWASAVQMTDERGEMWFVEFHTTPPGRDSAFWITLAAIRGSSSDKAALPTAAERIEVLGPWTCWRRENLITAPLLDEILASRSRS